MKYFFLFCALCCFIAVLRLPIDYYTFLRIIIFIGAGVALYHLFRNKIYYWTAVFGFILILFNPVFPVYLHKKSLWIPLDIITGIIFLCLNFIKRQIEDTSEEKEEKEAPLPERGDIVRTRDRIVTPRNQTR
ncbi:hypothetical protein OZ664_19115 [Elizabethkingia sp. HX WHF]|uniref:DUF6804 family protein n=1 Tax=Elizabethkingia TaxID=308865 RepID=UPI00099934B2|nr:MULTISPECIES: DUF6804 family protein [Elizabethkingia]ATL45263.1 hypothetical protein CQS02_19140 [Elizabethkingia miricola]MCL1639965.1 hypothetical protein [Elizabethkingia bruuniana]MDX8566126.1 hypothetical protein [Elizabethkingia sp. HX WHF]OPC21722.1 hypothetical protein BAY00_08625 [Elizabethkingia bruuniana]OPC53726.1 hypothetical protein BAY07_16950 [Elizabethkingia bruuniana]